MIKRAKAIAAVLAETLPGRVLRKFLEDQGPKQGVVIAWNALFSLFPILLAMAAILGLALNWTGFRSDVIYRDILSAVPDAAGRDEALKALAGVKQRTGLFFVVGLLGLVWSGSSLFGTMEQAFDLIYHTVPRSFVPQKLMGLGMMLLFTVLAGLAVGTSSLLPLLGSIPGVPISLTKGPVAFAIQAAIGVVAGFVLFGAIYFVVPNRRQHLTQVWPGALLAGVAFELLTLLFPVYLHFNQGINQYGKTFALLFVLMTFFYFLGVITMLGVELNAVIYPVPIPQPERAAALAPPQSGPEGEREVRRAPAAREAGEARPPGRRAPAPPPSPSQGDGERRAPWPKRALLGVLGAAIGVFAATRASGRRSRRPA
jgi:membrane protein